MNEFANYKKPQSIVRLGNNTYYYNYYTGSYTVQDENSRDVPMYKYIQVHLAGVPNYKDCVKAIIREYISQEEEFDMINSYAKAIITGARDSGDITEYKEYLNLLDSIKTKVKADFAA